MNTAASALETAYRGSCPISLECRPNLAIIVSRHAAEKREWLHDEFENCNLQWQPAGNLPNRRRILDLAGLVRHGNPLERRIGMASASVAREYLILIFFGTLMLILPSIYNGFPFVFTDTMDYIILTPRLYRSPFYSAFVFFTGWKVSLWPVVFAQSVLASSLVVISARRLDIRLVWVAAILVILGFASSLPIFSSYIMPDIFTGVMFLSIYIIMFQYRQISLFEQIYVTAVLILSISCHLSHLVMAIGIIVFSFLLAFLHRTPTSSVAGLALATASCLLVSLLNVLFNFSVHGSAELSPAGRSFLLATLVESGPARRELRDTCPEAGYRLCRFVDDLPTNANHFLWRKGPFLNLGGFEGMKDEAGAVVAATLRNRPIEVMTATANNFGKALLANDPGLEIKPMPELTSGMVKIYGQEEARAMEQSRQSRNQWPRLGTKYVHLASFLLACLFLPILIWNAVRRRDYAASSLGIYALAAYLGAALACSALAGVFDRYQARVSWVLVFAAAALVCRHWVHNRSPGPPDPA